MDKLNLHSPNFVEENIAKLAELFPNCVTESADFENNGKLKKSIDFDLLKQELSTHIVEGETERYRLDWPGKRKSLFTANTPINKTLRPCRKESVDFDSTKNLFIEGDNLEALKLLQETYLGKVKMIYIDPPYNTGKDFIYKDNFSKSTEDYLLESEQKDEDGNRLVANTESNGRFHSDWLSMMYSRLKLARKLLRDDGVIFISIDDNEIVNIRKILDEGFGSTNFLFQITVLCNPKGRSQDKFIANCHEYLIGYSKQGLDKGKLNVLKSDEEISKNYKLKDDKGLYRELELRNTHREFGQHNRKNLYYPFHVDNLGKISLDETKDTIAIYPNWDDDFKGCWTWGLDKARDQLDEIVAKKIKDTWKIYRKNYAENDDGEATKQIKSIWFEKLFHTEKGQSIFNELFQTKDKIFQSPKSLHTIKQLLLMATFKNDIILDFFAGSATTAHAVMQLNAEDGGNRQFIMVQLPELCDEKSEAFKAGYATIAEISKERIRRAGKKIKEDSLLNTQNLDIGFRVLKIDSSNMKDVYYTPDAIEQEQVELYIDNVKTDRTSEDLLFQVLVDWGVDLSLPIIKENIYGHEVFFVDTNALVACFTKDGKITENFCKTLAKRLAEHQTVRVVFQDAGFKSDSVKINVEQIFKQISPRTDVKTI